MTADSEKQPQTRGRRIWLLCVGFLLLFLALSGIMITCALRPLQSEAGEALPAESEFCRFSFLPLHCVSDWDDASLSAVGVHRIRFTLFGLPLSTTLTVQDTRPPTFTLRDSAVLGGQSVRAQDFIQSAEDFSGYSCELIAPEGSETPGKHQMRLLFTDGAGNKSEGAATLTVYGHTDTVFIEAGSTEADFHASVRKLLQKAELVPGGEVDLNTPGESSCRILLEGHELSLRVLVEDTTPPEAELRALYTLNGHLPSPEEYLISVTDATAVTVAYETAPDATSEGIYPVKLVLTDGAGNRTRAETSLTVLRVPAAITLEVGVSHGGARSVIIRGDKNCTLADEEMDISTLPPGVHSLGIKTPGGVLELALTLRDTTPPRAEGKRVAIYLPSSTIPTPMDFLENIKDASPVTASFAQDMNFATPGISDVQILLTDAAGNTSEVTAVLEVYDDHVAPVITGVRNLTTYVGARLSYKSGVSAWDNDGSEVGITVDSSSVKLSVPGKYKITYTATDSAGNSATATATVTVLEVTEDVIRPYAENVLDRILKPDMTEREKARAIYDWMTSNVSYVTYADKTYWMRAAYTGFTSGRGDCYVYYAMSRILLSCAGIENMEIKRNIPSQPHYWNLVNCGDGWYHFDTCPHYKQYPLTSFMLTDAQVREYSEKCVKNYYSFDTSLYPATPEN